MYLRGVSFLLCYCQWVVIIIIILDLFDVFVLDTASNEKRVAEILNERCDGNRNVIQACVAMCTPQSNSENNDPLPVGKLSHWINLVCLLF